MYELIGERHRNAVGDGSDWDKDGCVNRNRQAKNKCDNRMNENIHFCVSVLCMWRTESAKIIND